LANLALSADSAVFLLPLAVVAFGFWDWRIVWAFLASSVAIAAAGIASHLVPYMPRWRSLPWDLQRLKDDCRFLQAGWILPLVMAVAIPLRSSALLKLSHRRLATSLAMVIGVLFLFPWTSGEHGSFTRLVTMRLLLVLMAGIVIVRHRSLNVVHPILLGAIALSWFARYNFRPPSFDFYPE
jgi:hypothetical protein